MVQAQEPDLHSGAGQVGAVPEARVTIEVGERFVVRESVKFLEKLPGELDRAEHDDAEGNRGPAVTFPVTIPAGASERRSAPAARVSGRQVPHRPSERTSLHHRLHYRPHDFTGFYGASRWRFPRTRLRFPRGQRPFNP